MLPLADSLTEGRPTPDVDRRAAELLGHAEAGGVPAATAKLVGTDLAAGRALTGEQLARLRLAAGRNAAAAQFFLHEALARDAARLTDEWRNESFGWLRKAAEAGHADAQVRLASEYYQQKWFPGWLGQARDFAAAHEWAKVAADQGHPDGYKLLAILYVRGDGVERNSDQAQTYYKRWREKSKYDHEWFKWFMARVISRTLIPDD